MKFKVAKKSGCSLKNYQNHDSISDDETVYDDMACCKPQSNRFSGSNMSWLQIKSGLLCLREFEHIVSSWKKLMLLFLIKGMAVLTFIICLLTNSKAAITNLVFSPVRYFRGLKVAKKAKKNDALK